jgi:uncharacterized protein (DUF488 family)
MYYRRKIILGLLETFDNKLNKTAFQKLLMLLSMKQENPSFDFVPYKYGCFSFQSNADIHTMIKYKQIYEDKKEKESYWVNNEKNSYINELKIKDKIILMQLKSKFNGISTSDLIKYTYKKYPYLAINSTISNKILTNEELKEVSKFKPVNNINALYTIGYEGISQERFLNKLLQEDIKVLCDVRRNPLSMKYGFSKNQLLNACNGVGIDYIHIPEVGIASSKRQKLVTQGDYDNLFKHYNENLMSEGSLNGIKKITDLLHTYNRVAITCFESNIDQCHRKHLALNIIENEKDFELIHL